jgi:hypothetical protein
MRVREEKFIYLIELQVEMSLEEGPADKNHKGK